MKKSPLNSLGYRSEGDGVPAVGGAAVSASKDAPRGHTTTACLSHRPRILGMQNSNIRHRTIDTAEPRRLGASSFDDLAPLCAVIQAVEYCLLFY